MELINKLINKCLVLNKYFNINIFSDVSGLVFIYHFGNWWGKKRLARWFEPRLSLYTGCPKSPVPISFSIFSTIVYDKINWFFSKDRPKHEVFFHKTKFENYCSKVLLSTEIQKLSLFSIDRISWIILIFKSSRSFKLFLYTLFFI